MSPFPIYYDDDAILGAMIYNNSFTAKSFAATNANVSNTTKKREREDLRDHRPFQVSPLPFPPSKPWFGNAASMTSDFKSSYEPPPPPKRARQRKIDDRRINFLTGSMPFQHSAYGMILPTAKAMIPMPVPPNTTNISKPSPQKLSQSNKSSMPPQPYTAYTIFFRLERALIHQSSGIIDTQVVTSLKSNHFDPLEHPRPAGYEHVVLEPYWYSSSNKIVREKKRKHKKTAGKLTMTTLSKSISANWKNGAGSEVMAYCQKLAEADKTKYNQLLQARLGNSHQLVNSSVESGSLHCVKKAMEDRALFVRDDMPDQAHTLKVSQDYPLQNRRLCTACGCTNSISDGSILCAMHGEGLLRAQNNTRLCTAGGCTNSIPEGSVLCAKHGVELLFAQRRLKNNVCHGDICTNPASTRTLVSPIQSPIRSEWNDLVEPASRSGYWEHSLHICHRNPNSR